jgi:SAM-dependent methyltransferase
MGEGMVTDDLPVIREVLPNDPMYTIAPERYFLTGRRALSAIELALTCAQVSPTRILDFASGAGRVMRYLKAAFPAAELTACDFHEPLVEFCERVFGVSAVVSKADPEAIELDGPFDLIWCGSLLTHIERQRWPGFLKLFETVVSPGGVVVFSTYGRRIVTDLRQRRNLLNLTEEQVVEVLQEYDATGFGFQPNRFDGDCIVSRAWVCTQLEQVPQLDLLLYMEHGWEGQDVIACKKRS